MKRISLIIILFLTMSFISQGALAYWVWTPESGKWVNPKYAVKDTPEEQFDLAIGFYKDKDYKRAISEFRKLLQHYAKSELAPTSQYYIGRVYEDMEEYYQAFLTYQKTIDSYPFTEKVDEIVEKEYRIANLFLTGRKAKILGVAILPALDRAIEIFKKVIDNSPYGDYAPLAQFKIAQAYKKAQDYESAIMEFQRLIDMYPESELMDDARYEIAYATYKTSLKSHYDQTPTDIAIKQFENFTKQEEDEILSKEAGETLRKLKEKRAKSLYETAFFYERQKKYDSAVVYYKEILEQFPDTIAAVKTLTRLKVIEEQQSRKK